MKLINNIKEMYKTMTYARTIGLVLALLLTSTAVWAVSDITNGWQAAWYIGDVANTTIGGVSLSSILGTDGENITAKKIGNVSYASEYATLQTAIDENSGGVIIINKDYNITSSLYINESYTQIKCLNEVRITGTSPNISIFNVDADHVKISNCYLDNNGELGTIGINTSDASSDFYLVDSEVRNAISKGVSLRGIRNWIVDNQIETGVGADGIALYNDDSFIKGNWIGGMASVGGQQPGIRLSGGVNKIIGNSIHNAGVCIEGYEATQGNIIDSNSCINMQLFGIRLIAVSTSVQSYQHITNNILHDISNNVPGAYGGIIIENQSSTIVCGNTFTGTTTDYDIVEQYTGLNNTICNNILQTSQSVVNATVDVQNEYTELTVANGATTGFAVLHPNMILNSSKVSVNGTVKYYGGDYDYTENVTHIIFSSAPTVNSKVYITYVSND